MRHLREHLPQGEFRREMGVLYCIGKRYGYKGVECHNVNYADFKLRRISASILGLEEFDEAEFERQIEEITVLEDGSLEYHFREGRTQTWQKM